MGGFESGEMMIVLRERGSDERPFNCGQKDRDERMWDGRMPLLTWTGTASHICYLVRWRR